MTSMTFLYRQIWSETGWVLGSIQTFGSRQNSFNPFTIFLDHTNHFDTFQNHLWNLRIVLEYLKNILDSWSYWISQKRFWMNMKSFFPHIFKPFIGISNTVKPFTTFLFLFHHIIWITHKNEALCAHHSKPFWNIQKLFIVQSFHKIKTRSANILNRFNFVSTSLTV